MNVDDALKINGYIEKIIDLANDVLYVANNSGDDESRRSIQRVLGPMVTALDLDILEPIYKMYPDLRPPGMAPVQPM